MPQTSAGGPYGPDGTGGPGGAGSGSSGSSPYGGNNGLIGDGRYRLTRRLGRGGMAEVWAAEDVRLGREVAVKLMRSDLAEDPVSKARFTREAQSVAGLNHHAVVAVYDSGEEVLGGNLTPYIVMELVEGHTIRDLLQQADAPPVDQALVIVAGVLEALAYSHQHGIVHRDIKPANVIITEAGAVKVMDFGIARAMHGASTTMTQTGMVMGTPQYLSPEQALGKTVDTRSDLYATGCLLYELLALRPPFTGETPLSVVYQHVQDDPRPPSTVSQDVPPELDGLVMRSLAKDPDDRFQTAEEMRGTVLYALRMLQEQGGHTGGLWSTGPAAPAASATPMTGTPTAATANYGGAGDTSQLGPPLLMGRPDRDDTGFEGGPRPDDGRRGGSGVKYALIAFLCVIAVAGGLFYFISENGTDDGGTPGGVGESSSAPKDPETSDRPSDRSTSEDDDTETPTEETDGGDTPSDSGSQSDGGDGSSRPSSPSQSPSTSTGGTDTGGTDTGGTDDGGASEGDDGGTAPTEEPTEEPTDPAGGVPGGGGEESVTGENSTGEAGGADPAGATAEGATG